MICPSILPAVPEADNEQRAAVTERLAGFGRLWLTLRAMVVVNVVVMTAHMLAVPDGPWRLLVLVVALAVANEVQLAYARRARTLGQLEWRLFASAMLLLAGGFFALHALGEALGEALGVLALAMVVAAYGPVLRARTSLGLACAAASMLLADVVAVRFGMTVLPGAHVDVVRTPVLLAHR